MLIKSRGYFFAFLFTFALLFTFIFSFNCSLLTAKEENKYKYQLAICSMFQNEAPYLKEWIEFHRLLGVEYFFLINHLSTDNFLEILQPYIDAKIVYLTNIPKHKATGHYLNLQIKSFKYAIKKLSGKAKWLAIIDTDEFIFPVQEKNLLSFLKSFEKVGGVCANWQMYGTSNIEKIPDHLCLIEALNMKGPKDFEANHLVKSIIRPERVTFIGNPHSFSYIDGYVQVDANGCPFSGPKSPTVNIDKIRINHYWTRDENFFMNVKIARRIRFGDEVETIFRMAKELNSEIDTGILRFLPALKLRLGK